ncbi:MULTISPECIES: DUF2142 domain-containing protein [Actinomycetaceae]|uniref:DUF2142 domain-containing protein n=1 Tax=Actinomycetaceae TaxID=2049 RepID=UPI00042604A8|nr:MULTISPECIES: DUF2142 domain-containing protein [Actinomycetaceae]WLD78597.1 DUF2142 domain-containing protein [Schaalia sp. HMT-172]
MSEKPQELRVGEGGPQEAQSASSTPGAPGRGRGTPARSRYLLAVLLVVAVIAASLAWVVSSPVGSSPDEDFHVGSMWCPPPVDETGCQISTKDGEKAVMVPQSLAKEYVTCYAFDHDNSAQCALNASDEELAPTLRWDDGNYPWGYYQFAHLFVQHSTNRAVLALRAFNALLAIGLLGAIIALADSGLRRAISVALTVAWLPMGFYFITGMNPSSWAMTGTFAFASALLASTRSEGRRRAGLIACALAGAVLACTSRGDSAFFLFVITVALAFAVPLSRRIVPEACLSCVASAVGIWVMSRTNVAASHLASGSDVSGESWWRIVYLNVSALPNYLRGFVGYLFGPGWNDVSYQGTVSSGASLVVVALLAWSLRSLSWRKVLSAITVAGAITGVPVVIGLRGHFNNVLTYQPRYMLPLFAVFMLMLLAPSPARDEGGRSLGSRPFRVPQGVAGRVGTGLVAAVWALTNARALYLVIERYAFGHTAHGMPIDLSTRNLSDGNEWWWPNAPVGPMTVWVVGALAGFVAIALAAYLWGGVTRERLQDH